MSDEGVNDRLRLLIERIERLEGEKKDISEDIKAVFGEAKAVGFDPKIMREVIKQRKMKPDDRRERNALINTYARERSALINTYAAELGLDLL